MIPKLLINFAIYSQLILGPVLNKYHHFAMIIVDYLDSRPNEFDTIYKMLAHLSQVDYNVAIVFFYNQFDVNLVIDSSPNMFY